MRDDHYDELQERLRVRFGLDGGEVRVQPDPFGGARIAIISAEFEGMEPAVRRAVFRAEIGDEAVSAVHLYAPDEVPSGELDSTLPVLADDLPLWASRLATGGADELVVNLPTAHSGALAGPIVAPFYSLRGGVGRSTALAHVAHELAKSGTVICVDLDLEAPGLASLFAVESEASSTAGVVQLLLGAEISGEVPNVDDSLVPIGTSSIYVLPAGVPDADYARRLALLDPEAWFREEVNPLRLLFEGLKSSAVMPDYILVDCRTGISPLSAPVLFELADVAMIVFFPHPQALAGTRALTRALLSARTPRNAGGGGNTPEPRFIASPIPGGLEVRKAYENRAIDWVGEWLSPARTADGEKPFDLVEDILHCIPYSEDVAMSDQIDDTASSYRPVAAWIAGLLEVPGTENSAGKRKSNVLSNLQFSTGTVEAQEDEEFAETFLQTDVIAKALSTRTPLVIGRKGTGKTAIFRRLAQNHGRSVVVTSPAGLSTQQDWMADADVYSLMERYAADRFLQWRSLWPAIILLAIYQQRPDQITLPEPPVELRVRSVGSYASKDLLRDVQSLLDMENASIEISDLLTNINDSLTESITLLFDGLDTGFGIADTELRRRREAIGGLLEFFLSRERRLDKLQFKIMLRDDVWRESDVPNKSHLFSRQVRLEWTDQADYLRLAVKQAMRSAEFRRTFREQMLQDRGDFRAEDTDLAYWPEELVYDAWILLVGERVSGGKTAFTYNWVWARLSDANEDHSPRTLLQLLHEALNRERLLNEVTPYERSLLRPRALVESLEAVSEQAVASLREEFYELGPLFTALEGIGRTPFAADELLVDANIERLGREVGLLGVDASDGEEVDRYRVPEVYRKALSMSRKGQA